MCCFTYSLQVVSESHVYFLILACYPGIRLSTRLLGDNEAVTKWNALINQVNEREENLRRACVLQITGVNSAAWPAQEDPLSRPPTENSN